MGDKFQYLIYFACSLSAQVRRRGIVGMSFPWICPNRLKNTAQLIHLYYRISRPRDMVSGNGNFHRN